MQYQEKIIDGVICSMPKAENELERKALDINYNIFCSIMADLIIKYAPELEIEE